MTTPSGQQHAGWSDERVEQVIGNLLRCGVLVSALVVFVGGVLYLYNEGRDPAPPEALQFPIYKRCAALYIATAVN